MVQEGKIFFWSVFVTAAISRRLNKTTTFVIFCRIKFFNKREALASVRVNRLGCGFFSWLNFFTAHVPDCEFKVIRNTLCEELSLKFKIICWSIESCSDRIEMKFFQHRSMRMSCLSLNMIFITSKNSF